MPYLLVEHFGYAILKAVLQRTRAVAVRCSRQMCPALRENFSLCFGIAAALKLGPNCSCYLSGMPYLLMEPFGYAILTGGNTVMPYLLVDHFGYAILTGVLQRTRAVAVRDSREMCRALRENFSLCFGIAAALNSNLIVLPTCRLCHTY